jgi:heme/copper-type cytochrome/quinol oxidase subunit 3
VSAGIEGRGRPVLEPEAADEPTQALWVGTRLVCGSTAFFFLPFVYAYFYLRAIDPNDAWKPAAVDAPLWAGVAVTTCFLVWAVLAQIAARGAGAHAHGRALGAGWAAFAVGLAAIVLQGVAYARLGFGPTDGGFASVYLAATGALALVLFFATMWLETVLVAFHRTKSAPDGLPLEQVRRMHAFAFYATFLAGIAVVLFVILYLL